jgi:hypothetical protein
MRIQSINHILKALSAGDSRLALRLVREELRRRWFSNESAYGLKYDLNRLFDISGSELPLLIRELSAKDVPLLLKPKKSDFPLSEFRFIMISLMLIEARLPTCYVGVTPESDEPLCMCWLINSRDYSMFREFSSRLPYMLQMDEVLCENIFTRQDIRGKHLMQLMTLRLFEKAKQHGAKQAIAFISEKNSSSLAGSKHIGWEPFVIKKIQWRFFKRYITFEPAA